METPKEKQCIRCGTKLFCATIGDSLFKYCPSIKCELSGVFQVGLPIQKEDDL